MRFGRQQLPNLYKLMDLFTVCDRYFSDYAGNSFPTTRLRSARTLSGPIEIPV